MKSFQFAVVGGGIMGLLTAKALSETGESVALFDRSAFGSESSWAGGGIISPLYPWRYPDSITALASQAQHLYPGLCHELHERTGIDPQFRRCGLAMGDVFDAAEAVAWAKQNAKPFSLQSGVIDSSTIELPEWLVFPEISQVRTPRLLAALVSYLREKENVTLQANCIVEAVKSESTYCQLQTNRGAFCAEKVALTTGAWTNNLFPKADIAPVKGQMIMFGPIEHQLKKIVLVGGRYLIPRVDGRIIVGSSLERSDFKNLPEQHQAEELEKWAQDVMPELQGKARTKHWSGLRPFRNDVPLIDYVDEHRRLLVNAGHFRNGVVLAPASSRLACSLFLEQEPDLATEPYSLMNALAKEKIKKDTDTNSQAQQVDSSEMA